MTSSSSPAFTPEAVRFLRALRRHNDREWFRERKAEYERHVRQPMEGLIARLDREFRVFAPEIAASPAVSLFRIYRDTRFSEDKSPLKTQVGAVFPHRELGRKAGAC
nr:TIGR02453 family protein [Vicinamibacterales bacterium]